MGELRSAKCVGTFMMLRRTALESLSRSFQMTGNAQSVAHPRANTKSALTAPGCMSTTALVLWLSESGGSIFCIADDQTSAFLCGCCIDILFLHFLQAWCLFSVWLAPPRMHLDMCIDSFVFQCFCSLRR